MSGSSIPKIKTIQWCNLWESKLFCSWVFKTGNELLSCFALFSLCLFWILSYFPTYIFLKVNGFLTVDNHSILGSLSFSTKLPPSRGEKEVKATPCIYMLTRGYSFYPRNVRNNHQQNYLQHSQIYELCAQLSSRENMVSSYDKCPVFPVQSVLYMCPDISLRRAR